jgi:hypothetical protein
VDREWNEEMDHERNVSQNGFYFRTLASVLIMKFLVFRTSRFYFVLIVLVLTPFHKVSPLAAGPRFASCSSHL